MDGVFWNTESLRRGFKQFDLPGLPDRWSQSQANDFLFLAAPETSHQQDASTDPSFAKGNCFVQRSHTEPARAFLLKGLRALDSTVPVGIGFHDCADTNGGADVPLYRAKVLPQGSQRH